MTGAEVGEVHTGEQTATIVIVVAVGIHAGRVGEGVVRIVTAPAAFKEGGKLADIAPTLLTLMGLPVPAEMTGDCLIAE